MEATRGNPYGRGQGRRISKKERTPSDEALLRHAFAAAQNHKRAVKQAAQAEVISQQNKQAERDLGKP